MNQKAATQFEKLLDVADRLLGKDGCPWDLKQSYQTLRRSLLEEAYEVIDAIDNEDIPNLTEELGDLLYNIVFLTKIGEKRKDFKMDEVCELVRDKLVSRHPHIFGDAKAENAEEVVELWEMVKKQEKKRGSIVPKALPSLARGYKLVGQLKKEATPTFETAEELGDILWELTCQARGLKIDPESALRTKINEEIVCYESSMKKN